MIRPAGKGDIDVVAKMICEDCHEMKYPVNEEYTKELIAGMIDNECLLFVHEKKDVVGVCAMLAAPSMFDRGKMILSNIVWYASKDLNQTGRARVMVELLDFMVWVANEKGMELHVSLPISDKLQNGGELLQSRGLVMTECFYRG